MLARRLETLRVGQALEEARSSLRACGVAPPASEASGVPDIDRLALDRLRELRAERLRDLAAAPEHDPRRRNLLRQIERLDTVLGTPVEADVRCARERLAGEDEAVRQALHDRLVLTAEEGGFALHPLIGWKAANLAEVARLGGGTPPFLRRYLNRFEDRRRNNPFPDGRIPRKTSVSRQFPKAISVKDPGA